VKARTTAKRSDGDPISRDALARMFARLTADRDALRVAIERCEQRIDDLVSAEGPGGAPAHDGCQGARALVVAEEALAAARVALSMVKGDDAH